MFAKRAFDLGISNPVLAIAAGVAMVAIGAAAQAKTMNKFAQGGIVTGPTYGLIGEAGPEVIFPLNQINRFMKQHTTGNVSAGGSFTVNHTISGSDLRLIISRDQNRQGGTSRF